MKIVSLYPIVCLCHIKLDSTRPSLTLLPSKIVGAFICHKYIIRDQTSRDKGTLLGGNNLIQKHPQSISKHLRAQHVGDIAKRDQHEILKVLWVLDFLD